MRTFALCWPFRCGFRGIAFERRLDGGIGRKIPSVVIRFTKEDGSLTREAITNENGSYSVELERGRYVVTATHPEYEEYSSAPGFFVVRGLGFQTGNIFLKKDTTTVLVLRHAEYDGVTPSNPDPSLNQAGGIRAEQLSKVVYKLEISAIFTTDTNRTKETVEPLRVVKGLTPILYDHAESLVQQIKGVYSGNIVLVVGHSDTVSNIIDTLVGESAGYSIDNEFHNLFIVTIESSKWKILNLQYGEIP